MPYKFTKSLSFLLLLFLMPACFCFSIHPITFLNAANDYLPVLSTSLPPVVNDHLTAIPTYLSAINEYLSAMPTYPPADDCREIEILQPAHGATVPDSEILVSWSTRSDVRNYRLRIFNIDNGAFLHRAQYETNETSFLVDMSTDNIGAGTQFELHLEARMINGSPSCIRQNNVTRMIIPSTDIPSDASDPSFVPSPTPATCTLTSPLEGLPNGVATFHWNPVPSATNYEIKLYNDQGALLTTLGSPTTPLSADVSQNAIGGQYQLTMEFIAYADGVVLCSEQYSAYREAPTAVPATDPPPTLAPTTAPTNEPTIAPTSEPTPEETPWIDCEDPQIYEVPEWYEYCTGEEWEFYE